MQPKLSDEGEFLGFRLRSELMSSAFMSSDYNYNYLRRILKVCMFVNRLLTNGCKNEFILKKLFSGEKDPSIPVQKANKVVMVTEADFPTLGG